MTRMILLKYAKLLHPSINGIKKTWWKRSTMFSIEEEDLIQHDERTLRILYKRTKDFVLAGYVLTAEDALGLTEIERRIYTECKEEVFRENIYLQGIANNPDPLMSAKVFTLARDIPKSNTELKFDYLCLSGRAVIKELNNHGPWLHTLGQKNG